MDIRNFFGMKKAPKAKPKSNEPSNNSPPAPAPKVSKASKASKAVTRASSSRAAANAKAKPKATSPSKKAPPSSSSSKKKTTDTKTRSSDNARSSTRKRSRAIIVESSDSEATASNHDDDEIMELKEDDDSDEDEVEVLKTSPPSKKSKSINASTSASTSTSTPTSRSTRSKSNTTTNTKTRTEISAQDFFATTQATPSTKKQKIESDDDETASNHEENNSDSEEEFRPDKDDEEDEEDEIELLTQEEETISQRKRKRSSPATNKKTSKPSPPSPPPTPRSPSPPKPKPKSKFTSTSTTSNTKTKKILVKPKQPYPKPFTTDEVPSQCLTDVTFVITGEFPSFPSREELQDFLKILGGRVTTAISGRTNYLLCGTKLEDGREVTEGSKYKKAMELGDDSIVICQGEDEFYGLIHAICEYKGLMLTKNSNNNDDDNQMDDGEHEKKEATTTTATEETSSTTKSTPAVVNPYTKKPIVNPYAKKIENPYAKKPIANPYAKKTTTSSTTAAKTSANGGKYMDGEKDLRYALWADKYAPSSTLDILGNGENVRKLTVWLNKWEATFVNSKKKKFGGPPPPKAALLSGPPGIGKTTSATLVAQASGREVMEWNASDVRSKKGMEATLGDVMGSRVLNFGGGGTNSNSKYGKIEKKRCIIMDEVDGMGAGDRSGMAELIKMIKESKVPIICICNDRQSQKVRSLASYCLDLRYRRPVKSVIAKRAVEIGRMENMHIEINAAEAIAESCGNDIRQVLNCIQMWSNNNTNKNNKNMTYKDLKERQNDINKDESLRLNIFDSTKMIIEGPKGLGNDDIPLHVANKSLFDRTNAYFTDYNLMGLNVHQNYLKVMISQYQESKRSDHEDEMAVIERMQKATLSMSDFAVSEHRVMSGDQMWGLLPLCSVLTVKAGHHAAGKNGSFFPGFPEFAGWLGKNSSRGKKNRVLQELNHHMNYNISADKTALRLYYLPILRERFRALMEEEEHRDINEVIEFMDEYGLDRDDLFENLDEFLLDAKEFKFASLDSKAKAAFTREYNKRIHKSQALIEEQSAGKNSKKKRKSNNDEGDAPIDLDAVNDDKFDKSDSEDEDDDMEAIRKKFMKKGQAKAAKGKKAGNTKAGGRKKKK